MSSFAEAALAVVAGLYILSTITWSHEEYWSVVDSRARFLPGTGMLHSLFYSKDKKPQFKKGVKDGPGITPGN